jgi:hypothetical protein
MNPVIAAFQLYSLQTNCTRLADPLDTLKMKFSVVIPLLLWGLSSTATGAPAHPEQPMITTKPDIRKAVDRSQKRNAAYVNRPISGEWGPVHATELYAQGFG